MIKTLLKMLLKNVTLYAETKGDIIKVRLMYHDYIVFSKTIDVIKED